MTTTDLIGEYIACARSGDWERAFGFFADDIRIRIPGGSELAGEHTGRDVARGYIEQARALSGEHEVEVELVDTLASDTRVALIVSERFHTADGPVEIRRCNVPRGRLTRTRNLPIFEADQYAVDALFGA